MEDRSIGTIKQSFHAGLLCLYEDKEIRSIFGLLAEEYLSMNATEIILHKNERVGEDVILKFKEALNQLRANVPVQYILGRALFLDHEIAVGHGVLIPRPETEGLVQMLISDFENDDRRLKILDIGTGSGCIPISILNRLDNVEITAVEKSVPALEYAKHNCRSYGKPVNLLQMDFLVESGWDRLSVYDIIISNPPYVTEEDTLVMRKNVLDSEPGEALFVGNKPPLFFYEKILEFSRDHLVDHGSLYLEINENYGEAMVNLFIGAGLQEVALAKDMNGKDRYIKACKTIS